MNLSKYIDQFYSVKDFLHEEGYKFHSFSWFDEESYSIDGDINRSYHIYPGLKKDKLFDKIVELNFNSLIIYFR